MRDPYDRSTKWLIAHHATAPESQPNRIGRAATSPRAFCQTVPVAPLTAGFESKTMQPGTETSSLPMENIMLVVALDEVQARLPELLARMQPGDELIIDQNGHPVARLIRSERESWPCQPGSAQHLPHWMAPDFDAPLEDFREYME